MKTRSFLAALAASTLMASALPVLAQSAPYPVRPLTMVVPYAPGGVADIVARGLAARMSVGLEQQVLVDNRPGASGNLGSMHIARAAPDGYQILFGSSGPQAINVALLDKMPYDPVNDLTAVALVATSPIVLVVSSTSPITSVGSLLATARAAKEPMTFSSAGNASTPHLAGEYFKQQAGVNLKHIPYKGDSPALNDVMGGHVDMSFPAIA